MVVDIYPDDQIPIVKSTLSSDKPDCLSTLTIDIQAIVEDSSAFEIEWYCKQTRHKVFYAQDLKVKLDMTSLLSDSNLISLYHFCCHQILLLQLIPAFQLYFYTHCISSNNNF